ncbi:uncharacterized protein LAESUDRAFT_709867 [Laetiporus sulphureus 93-53]|uniref:RNI-like protein n=1 Tax=Laetiporus sulphureus 93-53 TaxID=1314785 RepID=A0A165I6D7_9APHY|nr:uncharacterized protein LAESUDRAFT_709867 [Laetiporus sulphureus 93-53]KZT12653.1 hypothetical protein LAESUDRAFT_709867 [Laetiporus sulphureus 93-53]
MGQRHQAFVIARVVPHGSADGQAKYRCIAAWHNQWCYERLPLRATSRLITLLKQKDNAEIVEAEIRSIHGKYGRFGKEPCIPQAPCPFTAALLALAWNAGDLDTKERYMGGMAFTHCLLNAGMGCWDGDNNDGISIIDVTDPGRPAYCFMMDDRLLSASGYLHLYRGDPVFNRRYIDALNGVEMISVEMLAEAWPKVFRYDGLTEGHPLQADTGDSSSTVAPLTDIALKPALMRFIELEDVDALDQFLWLPGKADQMKSLIRELKPIPATAALLLRKLYGNDIPSLDLTDFDLTQEVLLQLVSNLGKLTALNLSFNTRITADTVHLVLTTVPSLRRLVLMGCTSVTEKELYQLLQTYPRIFYNLEALMHPTLLKAIALPAFPASFTYIASNSARWAEICGCSLPVFTPESIVRSLTDAICALANQDTMYTDYSNAVAAVCGVREREKAWNERSVVTVPVLSTQFLTKDYSGWALLSLFNKGYTGSNGSLNDGYAFVRAKKSFHQDCAEETESRAEDMDEDKVDRLFDIFDVRGFAHATAEEGRPSLSETAIEQLELYLCRSEDTAANLGRLASKLKKQPELMMQLMSKKQVAELLRRVAEARQRLDELY